MYFAILYPNNEQLVKRTIWYIYYKLQIYIFNTSMFEEHIHHQQKLW